MMTGAIDGERQRVVETSFAVAPSPDPAGCHLVVVLDRRGYRPAHRLKWTCVARLLETEKKPCFVRHITAIAGPLAIRLIGTRYFHHRHVVVGEHQTPLAIGSEAHIALGQGHAMRHRIASLAQALHVERHLLQSAARSLCAHRRRAELRAHAALSKRCIHLSIPRTDGFAFVIE